VDKFKVGDHVSKLCCYSERDVKKFADLSGDSNPIHLDKEFAKNTIFGERIVHGMLVVSVFSALIANEIPGTGSIYLHQSIDFKSPVKIDQNVSAIIEIVSIKKEKGIYELRTFCVDDQGDILVDGKAIVMKK